MSHTTVIAVPVAIVRSDPSFIPTAIRDMRIATNWTGLCPGPPPLREALRRAAVALAEAGRLGRSRGPLPRSAPSQARRARLATSASENVDGAGPRDRLVRLVAVHAPGAAAFEGRP